MSDNMVLTTGEPRPLWSVELPKMTADNIDMVIGYLESLKAAGTVPDETPVKKVAQLLPSRDRQMLKVQLEYKNDDWEGFTEWLRWRYDPGGRKFKSAKEILMEENEDPIYTGQIANKLANATCLIRGIDEFSCEERKMVLVLRMRGDMRKHGCKIYKKYNPTTSFESLAKQLIKDVEEEDFDIIIRLVLGLRSQ
ncbi:hypothetical protein GGF46_005256 [Coemansia sp. RSA 552]|nr:hypothetical protein GGF46_005256 [Coemansia sp. RSA 552]